MRVAAAAPLLALAGAAAAPVGEPAPPGRSRAALEQLNRETQALYAEVQPAVVRVQLPTPRWVSEATAEGSPLQKYKDLDPQVRRQLQQQLEQQRQPPPAGGDGPGAPPTAPTTRPPGAASDAHVRARGRIIVVPPLPPPALGAPRDAVLGGRMEWGAATPPPASFAPNQVGLVLDDAGHVLVPLYVERETCAGRPVMVAGHDGRVREAAFVGSDRPTNVTVLRLTEAAGTPVRAGPGGRINDRPADGSLLLYVSLADGSGRLGLWDGSAPPADAGAAFRIDGHFAGVARYGQFLSARACRLIADQLIRHGAVRRATLGVAVTEVRTDDPLRRQLGVQGAPTAMRIEQVMPGSAAEKAGLRPGDALLALAGEAVGDLPTLAAAIAARSGPTELQVLRDGNVIRVEVDLQPK